MTERKYDITALGELLIDFTENGISQQGNVLLEANPGGAPCNVLAMLAKLGKKSAFIGKVGQDRFGSLLKEAIESVGIHAEGLIMDKEVHTTLAFVHTYPDGDRDFSFYRNPGADMMLKREEVPCDIIMNSRIFHFGSLSFTHAGVREASMYAIQCAKEAGALVSFDPNLREPLWNDLKDAKEAIGYGMACCDILKISDNELIFMTGETDYDKGAFILQEKYKIPLVCVTLGKEGSRAYYKGMKIIGKPFVQENTIETTGAGDTFTGCMLDMVLEKGLDCLTERDIRRMLLFANAGASLVTTKRGALKVMPDREEIEELLEKIGNN
ncbi:carbohydrate kinase [Lachnoclostridium pacaense]|uniref:carbohydrate kinase family protein n=1 Tax=Enterocloster hominis (ex Hitch et al. 2024) TaxID=1917870 RepID=UPI001D129B0F|nr:carbohydrate kinase [Lachnoclostridium pacaense]MCC2878053.1 carbohydrate kinase [Lachnoclostridium pacaense]